MLHWLELAEQQGAAINRHFIRNLCLTQVQIDELWSYVKKNRRTGNQMILTIGEMPGSGMRWRSPAVFVLLRISHRSAARKRRRLFWRLSKPGRTGARRSSPVISCPLMWQRSLPTTVRLNRRQLNEAVVVCARRRVEPVRRAGRSRWKVENEIFHTLKNQGYHFAHNDGHGEQNLAMVLVLLMFPAFTVAQMRQRGWHLFRQVRAGLRTKAKRWDSLRRLFRLYRFQTMTALYQHLADLYDIQLC